MKSIANAIKLRSFFSFSFEAAGKGTRLDNYAVDRELEHVRQEGEFIRRRLVSSIVVSRGLCDAARSRMV